jgi:hypothetical protein
MKWTTDRLPTKDWCCWCVNYRPIKAGLKQSWPDCKDTTRSQHSGGHPFHVLCEPCAVSLGVVW